MIIYRDTQHATRRTPPPGCDGAVDLVERPAADGSLWAIGDGILVGPAPDRAWTDIGDGWQARLLDPLDTQRLRRDQRHVTTSWIADLRARHWAAPVVLADGGERALRVTYGADFLPALTDDQRHAEAIARAARDALVSNAEIDMALAARWTADLLAFANHVAPATLAALHLIDDALVVGVLSTAAGVRVRIEA
jgi:hypothetical protein